MEFVTSATCSIHIVAVKMDGSTLDPKGGDSTPKLLPASPKMLPVPYQQGQIEEKVIGEGHRVVLFNDEFHTMEEVALQLMKALRCPRLQAEEIMFRAHARGHATVTITDREEAERIAGVLREIALIVSVDPV